MIDLYEQFASSVSSLYFHIQKIQRTEMARYGLKGAHVHCLLAISRHPEGITAARLCQICDKDKAAVSRTLAELEKEGLVTRPADCTKHYRVPLFLTEKGKQITEQVSALVTMAVQQADCGLSQEKREICFESMDIIAQNLHRISTDGIRKVGNCG